MKVTIAETGLPGRPKTSVSSRVPNQVGRPGRSATRRAAQAAARLAGQADADYGGQLDDLLADRPLAMEQPAPALTALTNRMLAYVEETR